MTTHNESLKPCPFCSVKLSEDGKGTQYYSHPLNGCMLSGHEFDVHGEPSIAHRWNRRAEQPQPAPMQDSREALSFTIDGPEHAVRVLTFKGGGCRPANSTEIALWDALASRAEHAVPEGWKLVPIEPTDEQIMWGHRANGHVRGTYSAMVKFAPCPTSNTGE